MKITIVLPTYNEVDNLSKLAEQLFELRLNLDLLIVDDNSPDGTGEAADTLASEHPGKVSVIHRDGKLGLGTAYIQGFNVALDMGSDVIAQMDSDFSHPPEKLLEMVEELKKYDLVIGSRYISGGGVDENWPLWRKGLSSFGNFYARTILNLPVRDTTGGFRLYRRSTLLGMPYEKIRSNGYAFLIESLYMAARLGFTIKEIPIYFADRQWGESKMSFQIQKEAAIRVWQILLEYRNLKSEPQKS
jgi:dolichol-phosphate mannosyltransferase